MGQKKILSTDDLEATPTEDEDAKTATSEYLFDHAADLDAHTKNVFEEGTIGKYCLPGAEWVSAFTATANRMCACPFFIARTLTIDRIGVDVTTGDAGKNAYLGIYTIGTDGEPDELVIDGGTVSVAGSGVIVAATVDQQLTKGWYCSAFLSDGTPIVEGGGLSLPFNMKTGLRVDTADWRYIVRGFYAAQAYGALPASFPAVTHDVVPNKTPFVAIRIASLD